MSLAITVKAVRQNFVRRILLSNLLQYGNGWYSEVSYAHISPSRCCAPRTSELSPLIVIAVRAQNESTGAIIEKKICAGMSTTRSQLNASDSIINSINSVWGQGERAIRWFVFLLTTAFFRDLVVLPFQLLKNERPSTVRFVLVAGRAGEVSFSAKVALGLHA